ncbi:maleylpyruvate isomerase family mycothiol-dependent enzyme [Nonomuraea sp. NPDC050556]|uniref:maleylpyruvate isomerase family mycothiol-dependent enzyme n=1 Tax=Nonomuraea sp. NPDC050556 TaxID=3364369 RepID=UPI0037A79071
MSVLPSLQAELAAATNRFLATVASLTDVSQPSLLPGWSRGHVLAHVARNADAHLNLLTWARTGVETPQYASLAARADEIEALAPRPVAEHLADLRDGAARLAGAVRDLPESAWSATVSGLRPPPHPAWYILVRRLREVEIHHVDLGAGYGPADWPPVFVRRELHDCRASWDRASSTVSEIRFPSETWTGLGEGPAVAGSPSAVLAWLTGRSSGEGIRVGSEGRMSVPAAPAWLTLPAPADLPATPPEDYP